MAITARVGRHARSKTQRHCQNHVEDQKTVISLLNAIPPTQGGAGGQLNVPIVKRGFAAKKLYQAICFFQLFQFPTEQTGFLEPGGKMIAKMEALAKSSTTASPASPASKPKSDLWDNLQDKRVIKTMRVALTDSQLDYDESIELIRHVVGDGKITDAEINDLSVIATHSKSIQPAARAIFESFVRYLRLERAVDSGFRLSSEGQLEAANMVCDFLKRSGRIYFPKLSREDIGVGLLMRIANPGLLDQNQVSLCGPAALLYNVALNTPTVYVRYVMDLFEKGVATLGRLEVKPSNYVRSFLPPSSHIAPVDWLAMASLRDSENWFLDYFHAGTDLGGITLPGELANWFRKAGYSDVREETSVAMVPVGPRAAEEANQLFEKKYTVCLFITDLMLRPSVQNKRGDLLDMHWVVQRSPIRFSSTEVKLQVFTWGNGNYSIPAGAEKLKPDAFFMNFYGYVAARP